MKNKKQLFALPFILAGTAFILIFGALKPAWLTQALPAPWVGNAFIDAKLKYQTLSLGVAFLVLAGTRLLAPRNAAIFYRSGEIKAPAQPVRWLGIKDGESWKTVGPTFALIVTLLTAVFIYLNLAKGQSIQAEHLHFLPFILLFSVSNAFVEESVTRLALVTSLAGIVSAPIIHLASAALFGIPHFFGTPGGVIGILMAGFLGWLLSKATLETRGFFWAWLIHFLQDVIIFTGLFLVAL